MKLVKPLFKTGYFIKAPQARLLAHLTLSRWGVSVRIADRAFGFTWGWAK